MMNVRFQFATEQKIGISVERLADGLYLDQSDGVFKVRGVVEMLVGGAVAEDTVPFKGRYTTAFDSAKWDDGNYVLTVHDLSAGNFVLAELSACIKDGSDEAQFGITVKDLNDHADKVSAMVDTLVKTLAELKIVSARATWG